MRKLISNKWFLLAVINLLFLGTVIANGIGALLWFSLLVYWGLADFNKWFELK
jgi:hypothetical protein